MEDEMAAGMRAFLSSGCAQVRALRQVQGVLEGLGCRAVLFGGVVRDALLLGAEARPRDLDVVFTGAQPWDVKKAFGAGVQANQMGGLKTTIEGVGIDMWQLERTWAFSEPRLGRKPSFDDLLWSASFNIEAGLADVVPELERTYDGGMGEALRTRVLEMQFPKTPSPPMLMIRAALFATRFGMEAGPRLRAFVKEHLPREDAKLDEISRRYFSGAGYAPGTVEAALAGLRRLTP